MLHSVDLNDASVDLITFFTILNVLFLLIEGILWYVTKL
jgi:hypothetical protein